MYRSAADRAASLVLGGLTGLAAGFVVLIFFFVLREAWPALRDIGPLRFLTDDAWRPTAGAETRFGMLPMLAGSLLVTIGAMLLAGPTGLLLGLFQVFYAPRWLAVPLRRVVELLGGVPSVLFGFWGLVALAPLIARIEPPGQSLLAGSLVLALMIVPTTTLLADGALRAVPAEHARSAAALGVGRAALLWHIVIPSARRGLLVALLLGAARAIGETMAVVMVCGNVAQLPESIFSPIRTITANLAMEMGYATAAHRSALFASGLILLIVIALAIAATELLRGAEAEGRGSGSGIRRAGSERGSGGAYD